MRVLRTTPGAAQWPTSPPVAALACLATNLLDERAHLKLCDTALQLHGRQTILSLIYPSQLFEEEVEKQDQLSSGAFLSQPSICSLQSLAA